MQRHRKLTFLFVIVLILSIMPTGFPGTIVQDVGAQETGAEVPQASPIPADSGESPIPDITPTPSPTPTATVTPTFEPTITPDVSPTPSPTTPADAGTPASLGTFDLSANGIYSVTVTPSEPTVDDGEIVHYTFELTGTLTDTLNNPVPNGTIVLNVYYGTSDWAPQAASIPPGCSSQLPGYGTVFVSCSTDANGDFSYTVGIDVTAPSDTGGYSIQVGLTENEPEDGRLLSPWTEYYLYVQTTDPTDDYVILFRPSIAEVAQYEFIPVTLELRGTLTNPGGTPVPNGFIYLENSLDDIVVVSLTLPPGCEDGWTDEDYQDIVCQVDENGQFDFSIPMIVYTTDDMFGTIRATLYEDTYDGGRTLVPSADRLVLVVDPDRPPPPVGEATVSISPSATNAEPGEPVIYTVTITGHVYFDDQGEVYLETEFPDLDGLSIFQSVDLSGASGCYPAYYDEGNQYYDVACATADDGSFNYTFQYTAITPDYVDGGNNSYQLYATLYSGDYWGPVLVTFRHYAELIVNGAPTSDITMSMTPAVITAPPGSQVPVTVTVSGTALAPYYSIYIATDFSDTFGNESLITDSYLPSSCYNADWTDWKYDVICSTTLDAPVFTFTFTFVVTVPEYDPESPNVYDLYATVHDAEPGRGILLGERHYVQLLVSAEAAAPVIDLVKTAPDTTIAPDDDLVYTVTLTNYGDADAAGAQFTDYLPDTGTTWSFTESPPSDQSHCAVSPDFDTYYTLTCSGIDLAADGGSFSVTVSSPTGTACGQEYVNGVYPEDLLGFVDANPNNNEITITQECTPELAITKSPDGGTANAGDPVSFTIEVSNSGPGPVTEVTLQDVLPMPAGLGGWEIESDTFDDCDINYETYQLTCEIASIPAAGSSTVTVTSETSPYACVSIDNTASVTASNADPATDTGDITIACPSVDVAKTANNPAIYAGNDVQFTITMTNSGGAAATDAAFIDPLPATSGTWTWTENGESNPAEPRCSLNEINPGEDEFGCSQVDLAANGGTFTVVLTSSTTAEDCGDITNTIPPTEPYPDANPDNNSATISVVCAPDPNLAKVAAGDGTIVPGGTLEYTITLSNDGSALATGAGFTDTLPVTGSTWSYSIDPAESALECSISGEPDTGQTLTCGPVNIDAGDTPIRVTVTSPSPSTGEVCTTFTNTVTATGFEESNTADNTAMISVNCIPVTPENPTVLQAGCSDGVMNLPQITLPADTGAIHYHLIPETYAPGDTVQVIATLQSGYAWGNVATGFEDWAFEDDTATFEVNLVQAACIDVTLSCPTDMTNLRIGDSIAYPVRIENTGPIALTTLFVQIDTVDGIFDPPLPLQLEASGQEGSIYTGSFITTHTKDDVDNGHLAIGIDVLGSGPDGYARDTATVTCEFNPFVDIAVTATGNGPVISGEEVMFTVVASNPGDSTATGVTLTENLPAGYDWTLDPDVTGCTITGTILNCTFAKLDPGEIIELHVTAMTGAETGPSEVTATNVTQCADLASVVTVAAENESPGQTANNVATASIIVLCVDAMPSTPGPTATNPAATNTPVATNPAMTPVPAIVTVPPQEPGISALPNTGSTPGGTGSPGTVLLVVGLIMAAALIGFAARRKPTTR